MTKDEFEGLMRRRLKDFGEYWDVQRREDPDAFPPDMGLEDWEEQLQWFAVRTEQTETDG